MSNLSRQFGILIAACILGLFSGEANAGYISFDSANHLTTFSLGSSSGSSSSSAPLDQNQHDRQSLNFFETPQMAMHLGQSGPGGMSSVGGSSGSQAPVGLTTNPDALTPALITPLFIGDEPFSPRMAISEIFRPPCA